MTTDAALYRLLSWNSPGYPTGAFSYSHGLEWAVESGQVRGLEDLLNFINAAIERGGGWVDAVFFVHAWRAANRVANEYEPNELEPSGLDELDELSQLATAFRSSSETALESRQQGTAFLQVTRRAWSHPLLDQFAARLADEPVSHCVVVALACAAHEAPLEPSLNAYLHAFAANLVSAGARLIPLGQTDAQVAISRLSAPIQRVCARALETALDDLGTAAPQLELCSMLHETQYTRLFRS